MMLQLVCLLAAAALVRGHLPLARSREEVAHFAKLLEDSRDGVSLAGMVRAAESSANAEELSGKFQGDILLDQEQREALVAQYARGARNGLILPIYFWPNNELVYDIQEDHFTAEQIAAIHAGMDDLANVSCVTFRRRGEDDFNYVLVTGLTGGCYAHVGYSETRGVASLNLQPAEIGVSCFRHGTVVHEFLHSFGFLHMHSTHNRDDYVEIVWDKLTPGTEHNFYIYEADMVSNYGTEYDFGSCLQYTEYAFSIDGSRTIVPIVPYDGVIGQRIGLSELDIIKLNRLHSCPGW